MLGERLKKARLKSGISQEIVALKLNVTRQTVSKWENDVNVPSLNKVIELSELYEISLDTLLKGEKIEQPHVSSPPNSFKDESWMLLLLLILSLKLFPMGLLISPLALWRNQRKNTFYHVIIGLAILTICYNLFVFYYRFILQSNWDELIF